MASHPYGKQPRKSFWSRAVANEWNPKELVTSSMLRSGDRVVSAGSCFASNMVPYIEEWGLTYVRTEEPHPAFPEMDENLGYRSFSAAYGNIYTARQLLQLLRRATRSFAPLVDRWHVEEFVVDPFRPGLRYPARSDEEFNFLQQQHFDAVVKAFQTATVLVFTLGLTEAWVDPRDGSTFPSCPGTVAGEFDPLVHHFANFSVDDTVDDLHAFIRELREVNANVRIILTVSPVPLVATATDNHVLVATTYSKSVLRVAADTVASAEASVSYFPAYEIVTGPQATVDFFEKDRRSVTKAAVEVVMDALKESSAIDTESIDVAGSWPRGQAAKGVLPTETAGLQARLSSAVAEAECDEALLES